MKNLEPKKDFDYVKVFETIEGEPIPEGRVEFLDSSYDKDVFDWLVENGKPCDEDGNEL